MVSGVGLDAYWLSSYLWDAVSMLFLVGFTLIVLAVSDVEALMDGEAAGATILLFLMYSISMVRSLCSNRFCWRWLVSGLSWERQHLFRRGYELKER